MPPVRNSQGFSLLTFVLIVVAAAAAATFVLPKVSALLGLRSVEVCVAPDGRPVSRDALPEGAVCINAAEPAGFFDSIRPYADKVLTFVTGQSSDTLKETAAGMHSETKDIIAQALPGTEEKAAGDLFGRTPEGAGAEAEGVFSLLGRFGDIVVSQVKEINVPCLAVSAMTKSGMMTSTAFDEACAKPAQAGDPQD